MERRVLQRSIALVRRNVEASPHPVHTTRARAHQHLEQDAMGSSDNEQPRLSALEGAGD